MGDGTSAVKEILEKPGIDRSVEEKKEEGLDSIEVMHESKPVKQSKLSHLFEMVSMGIIIEVLGTVNSLMAYDIFTNSKAEYLSGGVSDYISLACLTVCNIVLVGQFYLKSYDYFHGTNRSS